MKFSTSILNVGVLASAVAAQAPVYPQQVNLTFLAENGTTRYLLDFPADGRVVETNNKAIIRRINAPDFNALQACRFETADPRNLTSAIAADGVTQQIVVTPAQAILNVRCDGVCTPTDSACTDQNGRPTDPCCNGVCAAGRCRAWNAGQN